jgi:hypothetical protein
MRVLKFPEDFTKNVHRVIPGAHQWLFEYNNGTDEMISIVGGGSGLYGDGITTFEMWDTKNMPDPDGYLTAEDINQWLQDHPVEEGE